MSQKYMSIYATHLFACMIFVIAQFRVIYLLYNANKTGSLNIHVGTKYTTEKMLFNA